MAYQVKWVEEHLGISRKALRGYEEKGLMPKNQDGRYRSYSDKEIQRIWTIRSLQGMGFSLKEIGPFLNESEENQKKMLEEKIKALKNQAQEIEGCIDFAKAIKIYEKFPEIPEDLGSMRFDEYFEKVLSEWKK